MKKFASFIDSASSATESKKTSLRLTLSFLSLSRKSSFNPLARYSETTSKGVYVEGVIESLDGVSESEFMERFIEFMDENGWYWNGSVEDIDE